jgi:hypothetical protein
MRGQGGGLIAAALALTLAVGAHAASDGPSEADRQTLRTYNLTMDKLRHFGAADKALYAASGRDPDLKAELARMADEEPQESLADLQAKLARHPKVEAFYRKEGLSDREAVVIPLATMEAMGAVETKGPSDATPAQIDFVRAHEAEIRDLLDQWFKQDAGDD